ncbi:Secreted RxLR effector peptide protein [Phytophthora palmivora]|uniref:RxLR effector protein n=1 Tax=Phytophthora palmivora TaxID=4796 RepID=A0A2P4YCK4_9STRA|nr:Secreted RxLR effector peptide protein [Phytophthora palmivora]
MRVPYILLAAVVTLFVHQVPVIASVGSEVALTGVTSLGLLLFVGADQSVSDQSRFLRGNQIDEGDKEERGKAGELFSKMLKTQSYSDLENVADLVTLKKNSAKVDGHLASVFKFAEDAKMKPDDLAIHLKSIHGADDDIAKKVVDMYTSYLTWHSRLALREAMQTVSRMDVNIGLLLVKTQRRIRAHNE